MENENKKLPEYECNNDDFLGNEKLLVSESENENDEENMDIALYENKIITDNESEPEIRVSQINFDSDESTNDKCSQRSKRRNILNSDEEDEEGNRCQFEKPAKISNLIDSDSSAPSENDEIGTQNDLRNAKNLDQMEDAHQSNKSKQKKPAKISTLIDSDSSAPSENEEIDTQNDLCNSKNSILSSKNKQKKPQRATAKKALDDIMHIQSEQQRLYRETHISIPYHKPKRYSLQEFLKRRTIMRPQTPEAADSINGRLPSKSPKMTTEELEAYAKLMEERAKEAAEFFKSESETEELSNDLQAAELNSEQHLDNATTDAVNSEELYAIENQTDKIDEESYSEQVSESSQIAEVIFEESYSIENEQEKMYEETHAIENITRDQVNSAEQFEGAQSAAVISDELLNEPQVNSDEALASSQIISVKLEQLHSIENQQAEELQEEIIYEQNINKYESEHKNKENFAIVTEVLELPRLDLNKLNVCMDQSIISPCTTPTATKKTKNIKHLLTAEQLCDSPSIKGSPNMLIDLDAGEMVAKQTTGIDNLLQRLLSSRKTRRSCAPDAVSILSAENGRLETSNVKLNLVGKTPEGESKEHKPGAAYVKLKQDLKSIITKKRLEELQKRQEGKEDKEEMEFSDDEAKLEPYDVIEINDEENIIDEETDDEQQDENSEKESLAEIDVMLKAEEEDNDEQEMEEGEESDEDDEIKETDLLDTSCSSKQKHRIIKAFAHDSDDDVDLLKTQTQHHKLTAEDLNISTDLETSTTTAHNTSALISQIPMTQAVPDYEAHENELIELCSGTFGDTDCIALTSATQHQEQQLTEHAISTQMARQIFCSDEDAADESEAAVPLNKVKKLKKKRLKQRVFSISDDETEDLETMTMLSEFVEEEDEQAVAETFVDYDSDENEVVVQMTKTDCRLKAADFVEKEAELSDSEWGSADEDEKNMDTYDVELGDEDEFDRDKLRHEVGQIHARKMLDQDIREVRKLQELFFEDEELDGVGRQRQFKWKNAEGGFSLDESRNGDADKTAGAASDDDEAIENNWRKIRFEREQVLQEERFKQGIGSKDDLNNFLEEHVSTRKIESNSILPANAAMPQQNAPSRFLIPKARNALHKKTVRGSFLVRDQETLLKIAGLKKNMNSITIENEDEDPITAVAATTNKQSKHFVFATLTEAEHELQNLKRKSKYLQSGTDENKMDEIKRRKPNPKENKCFIDQLL